MDILEDVNIYSDIYEISREEYTNILQTQISKETEWHILSKVKRHYNCKKRNKN